MEMIESRSTPPPFVLRSRAGDLRLYGNSRRRQFLRMISPAVTGRRAYRRCFRYRLASTLAALLTLAAIAAESPRPPEERFANEIRHARNSVEWRQGELKWLSSDLDGLGDFGRADLVLLRQDFARSAASWQTVAETYQRGEAERAKELQREAEAFQPTTHWRTRIEARHRQADLWPADDWVMQLTARWRGPMQRGWAPKFIEARRRASTAWARAAEAVTQDADPRKLTELEDAAWNAEFDARAAEAVFNSNEDKDRVLHDPKISSEDLERKLAEITALETERLEFARAQAETERKRRDWERRRKAANKSLAAAYETAAKEFEAERRKKRP
jgi:hypothetical protein